MYFPFSCFLIVLVVDYFDDVFSPVVSWACVRLLLILSIVHNWKTVQVDYTLAFVQATIEPGKLYCKMPKGYEQEEKVLELKRNLYGQRDAPKNFFEHLSKNLRGRGFTNCTSEPCLFISKDVIILVYVDDCIFISREEKHIDSIIESLRNPSKDLKNVDSMLLDKEEDYAGFLGIDLHQNEDGTIELLQTGLIDKIVLTDVSLEIT